MIAHIQIVDYVEQGQSLYIQLKIEDTGAKLVAVTPETYDHVAVTK